MMTSLALFHSKKFKEYSRCLYWTIVSSLKAAPVFNLKLPVCFSRDLSLKGIGMARASGTEVFFWWKKLLPNNHTAPFFPVPAPILKQQQFCHWSHKSTFLCITSIIYYCYKHQQSISSAYSEVTSPISLAVKLTYLPCLSVQFLYS